MKSTFDHYIALAAAMIIVALQHREKPWFARTLIAGASGGIGYSLAPEVAQIFTWMGERMAMVMITALGYGAIDVTLALLFDRDSIKELARAWLFGWGRGRGRK